MNALAIINSLLALAAFVVFALMCIRAKTAIRFVYGMTCFYSAYVVGVYGHLFVTGYSLGVEFTRPATGFALIIILALGIYEYLRR